MHVFCIFDLYILPLIMSKGHQYTMILNPEILYVMVNSIVQALSRYFSCYFLCSLKNNFIILSDN